MSVLGILPMGVDDDGWLFLPADEDTADGWHRYVGLRAQLFRDPDDPDRAILQQLGGRADIADFITDGVAASLSAAELRALARDLLAAADELQPPHDIYAHRDGSRECRPVRDP